MINPGNIIEITKEHFKSDKPPVKAILFLRYTLFFSFASIILALFPFRLIEFIYSIWVLIMLLYFGRFLVNWTHFSRYWEEHQNGVDTFFRRVGAMFFLLGLVTIYFCYRLLSNTL